MNEVIHNRTQVHLGWLDRLRVLVGKTIHVEVDIEVAQPEVNIVKSTSRTWVEQIIPPRRGRGYEAIMKDSRARP